MADSPEIFDPYHSWLGIPPDQQPPNHYRLLGLELFESDADVIDIAANRQVAYLRQVGTGSRRKTAAALGQEIADARRVLINAKDRAGYDEFLRKQGISDETPTPPPVNTSSPTVVVQADASTFTGVVPDADRSSRGKASSRGKDAEAVVGKKSRKPLVLAGGVVLGVSLIGGMIYVLSRPDDLSGQPIVRRRANSSSEQAAAPSERSPAGKESSRSGLDFQFANLKPAPGAVAAPSPVSAPSPKPTKKVSAPKPTKVSSSKPTKKVTSPKPARVLHLEDPPLDDKWLSGLDHVEDFSIDTQDLKFSAEDEYLHFEGKLYVLKKNLPAKEKWYGRPFEWVYPLAPGESFSMNFKIPKNMSTGTRVLARVAGVRWIASVVSKNELQVSVRFPVSQNHVQLTKVPYASDNGRLYTVVFTRDEKRPTHIHWMLVTPAKKQFKGTLGHETADDSMVMITGATRGTGPSGFYIDNLRHGVLKTPWDVGKQKVVTAPGSGK